eukprot:GHVU01013060.1.p1 GENE.GHVU01013060.1~~GHVU01013060.1.p1  ORF type:complete len:153 (-),score=0.73 GHVU01013060.1:199-657(-)
MKVTKHQNSNTNKTPLAATKKTRHEEHSIRTAPAPEHAVACITITIPHTGGYANANTSIYINTARMDGIHQSSAYRAPRANSALYLSEPYLSIRLHPIHSSTNLPAIARQGSSIYQRPTLPRGTSPHTLSIAHARISIHPPRLRHQCSSSMR